ILAAVHFEWMVKRAILKLAETPTKALREELEGAYTLQDYKKIWEREVEPRFGNAALGTVLGRLTKIRDEALKVRGRIVHGNGTVRQIDAEEAIDLFLEAGMKLREFATKHGEDLDTVLKRRIIARKSK
ncbi:hypothetical protein ACFL0I_04945, partial [Gemmatimonadota bacterium]